MNEIYCHVCGKLIEQYNPYSNTFPTARIICKDCEKKQKVYKNYLSEILNGKELYPRKPERIDVLLKLLEKYWKKHPNLRLGQIFCNMCKKDEDLFYIEDDELIKRFYKEDTVG